MKLGAKDRDRIVVIATLVTVGGLGYYLGSPLFINRTISEAPPADVQIEEPVMNPPVEQAPAGGRVDVGGGGASMNIVVSGAFVNGDDFHKASGKAFIIKTMDGKSFLRFEMFEVRNGPDLFVYLAKGKNPADGFVDLGALKGNIGDQNYEIPSDVDISKFSTVLIWCRAFSVLFGSADLA